VNNTINKSIGPLTKNSMLMIQLMG